MSEKSEPRYAATRRLQADGRWTQARIWRLEMKQRHITLGMDKIQANDLSWLQMISKFPPEGVTPADIGDQPIEEESPEKPPAADVRTQTELDELEWSGSVDLVSDTLWVYECLGSTKVTPLDAPSPGAWHLLEWAKRNRNHFFERLLLKAMSVKEKASGGEEEELKRAERMKLEELEKVIKQLDEGTKLFYCQKCWKQLEPDDTIEVVRKKAE